MNSEHNLIHHLDEKTQHVQLVLHIVSTDNAKRWSWCVLEQLPQHGQLVLESWTRTHDRLANLQRAHSHIVGARSNHVVVH